MVVAQAQVLNKILNTKDFSLVIVNNLTEDHFYLYKNEFNYIKDHYKAYDTVPDPETFISVFPDFDRFVVNEPDSFLIEELLKDYNQQYLTHSFNKVKKLLSEGKVDEATAFYKKAVENMQSGATLTSIDVLNDTTRYDTYLERTKDYQKFFITTGFRELDEILGGWDRENEYALIVARTNSGKSWVALKMAVAAAEAGLNVGLYSGEMSTTVMGYRADALISHIANGSLIHGNISVQRDYELYMATLPGKYKGSLKIITKKEIAGPATVGALGAFIEKEHLDMLVVDQVSLLKDQNKGDNPRISTLNISADLQNLQQAKKIPIIAVSQLNRTKNADTNDDSINTEMISESDRLGQDASTVIGVIRDKKDPSVLKLQVVKSRNGPVGDTLTYHVDLGRGMFDYIPTERDKQPAAKPITQADISGEVF